MLVDRLGGRVRLANNEQIHCFPVVLREMRGMGKWGISGAFKRMDARTNYAEQ